MAEQVSKALFCCPLADVRGPEKGVPRSTCPIFLYRQLEEVTHFTKSNELWVSEFQTQSMELRKPTADCCETKTASHFLLCAVKVFFFTSAKEIMRQLVFLSLRKIKSQLDFKFSQTANN